MKYTKPTFTEIRIDKDISLVMMTTPEPPGDPEESGNGGDDSNKEDALGSPFD